MRGCQSVTTGTHNTPTAGSRRRTLVCRRRTHTPTAAVGVWPSAYGRRRSHSTVGFFELFLTFFLFRNF